MEQGFSDIGGGVEDENVISQRMDEVVAERVAGVEPTLLSSTDPEFYERKRTELEQKIRERDEPTEA